MDLVIFDFFAAKTQDGLTETEHFFVLLVIGI